MTKGRDQLEGRQESGEHGRDCGWGLVEASFGRLRSRHGEAWFGCARGVSLERRKECVVSCNGRESVKSVFEEVEWRVLLKRFEGAKEPGRREEVSAAREARRNGLRAAVEKESLWGVWKMQSRRVECRELVGGGYGKGFAMVTRTMLGGEQFGWGAVSGGKEVHGLAFVK